MENLLESLYVDPRGASTFNITSWNTIGAAGARSFSATDRLEILQLTKLLNQPQRRAEAILQLSKVYKLCKDWGSNELGLLLWNSKGTTHALLKELISVYRLLSPPRLGMGESTRVCNALALLQCIASQLDAKMGLIEAKIPMYIYPFLNTTEQQLVQFEYLRLHSLGVIGALVKDGSNATEIVHFFLETEIAPLCLRCMDVGSELTKSVAILVLSKILEQQEGKLYFGLYVERFFAVSKALSKVVDEFSGKPPAALMKNLLICYLHLSEVSRCCDAMRRCYPQRLRNPAYLNFVCDESTRRLADQVLHNVIVGHQIEPKNLLSEVWA